MNAAIAVMLLMGGILAFVGAAFITVPLLIGYGLWRVYVWHSTRPVPIEELAKSASQVTAPNCEDFAIAHGRRLFEDVGEIATEVLVRMAQATGALYRREDLDNPLPPAPPRDTIDEARYRDKLIARTRKTADLAKTIQLFGDTLHVAFRDFVRCLPPVVRSSATSSTFTVPLIDLIDARRCANELIYPFYAQDLREAGLFDDLRKRFDANLEKQKGVFPKDFKGDDHELVRAYFADTPLLPIFFTPVPFAIPHKAYREHGAIFAPSGHGKTQLLQSLIVSFLQEDDPPAMFIIDSQGSMLDSLERLSVFTDGLADRLVILDPPEPALNFFQLGETSDTETMELATYLFSAIDRSLTAKQGTSVPYLLKLLREIPDATLDTLREVMGEKIGKNGLEDSAYRDYILRLDKLSQDFFRNQFYDRAEMAATRKQVESRLFKILGSDAFRSMFAAKENRFSALRAMEEKKIVLINTSHKKIGTDGSAVFGRFMIAQILRAAYQRDPNKNNPLALLIVDEAHEYFDETTEKILSQARKYGLGFLFATQLLDKMPQGVRAAVFGNTSIKFAGPVQYSDAMALSREMHCAPDLIQDLKSHDRSHTEFACHVRNFTGSAVKLSISMGVLEREPKMAASEHRLLRQRNRERYGASGSDSDMVDPIQADPFKVGDPVQIRHGEFGVFKDDVRVRKIGNGVVFVDGLEAGVPLADVRPYTPPPMWKVGDMVQVTLDGQDQYPEETYPDGVRIRAVFQEQGYVFVDGSLTGIPFSALSALTGRTGAPQSTPQDTVTSRSTQTSANTDDWSS